MRDYKEKSRQPSERLCGYESNFKANDNRFLNQVHYKSFLLQLPPIAMNKDQQYEFMKKQISNYLPAYEYDAAIRSICDVLDY